MKPIEELTGLAIDSLLGLHGEFKERNTRRMELQEVIDTSTGLVKVKAEREWEEIVLEISTLSVELNRLARMAEYPPLPPIFNLSDPLFNPMDFYAGVEHGKSIAACEAANNRHAKHSTAKQVACALADTIWRADLDATIGDVAEQIEATLIKYKIVVPTTRAIQGWLVDADNDGVINIPPDARKPGRRKKPP